MTDSVTEMKCEVCGRGPQTTGDTVFSRPTIGDSPVYRCKHHGGGDDETRELASLIEGFFGAPK